MAIFAAERMAEATALDPAFRGAEYRVELNGHRVTVRIDQRCPAPLAAWLTRRGCQRGWIVTAHNPRGQLDSPAQNRRRAAALERRASTFAAWQLRTRGVDPAGNWPDETGLLLAGVPAVSARRLGARFAQAAIVKVERSHPAQLFWLR